MKNNAAKGGKRQGPPGGGFNPGILGRLVKMLFGYYPVLVPIIIFCIIFAAVASSIPAIFIQQVTAAIEKWAGGGDWAAASAEIVPKVTFLISMYVLSIIAMAVESQLLAYMTQGFLSKLRKTLFNGMQNLPIKYFDTRRHGDIMSIYTNDIDTLRQLSSQTLPTIIRASVVVLSVFCIMLWYSVWLTLLLVLGVIAMMMVSGKIGGGSAKYFIKLQNSVGKQEGFAQEMMNGQKVVKVF